jgi:hypothetical protein
MGAQGDLGLEHIGFKALSVRTQTSQASRPHSAPFTALPYLMLNIREKAGPRQVHTHLEAHAREGPLSYS